MIYLFINFDFVNFYPNQNLKYRRNKRILIYATIEKQNYSMILSGYTFSIKRLSSYNILFLKLKKFTQIFLTQYNTCILCEHLYTLGTACTTTNLHVLQTNAHIINKQHQTILPNLICRQYLPSSKRKFTFFFSNTTNFISLI